MAQQVKFYSVASLPENIDQNGLYFKDGGELYKGSSRFGAGRVTTVADVDAMSAITGMVSGDIAICTNGGTFAYDGTEWKESDPTVALVGSSTVQVSYSGSTRNETIPSVIFGVKQDNGKVTAYARSFP